MRDQEFLKEIARELPTPGYLFDIDAFASRAEAVKAAFGEKTGICFSIKANPFLLGDLPEVFDKIEVCSPGELTICEKTGVDMGKVIFSGVNKTAEDVERAMEDRVGVFTAESYLHLDLINASALKRGKVADVLVRLTGGSQFGMDEADVLEVIANRNRYAGIRIVGIHFFTGTQKSKVKVIEKELNQLGQFLEKVKTELNFTLERVEYGTGLAVDYFCQDGEEKEMARLEAVAPAIRAMSEKVCLTVEMGRFFAAPCGYYFTKVMDVKTNCGINYAIVDGGLNQLKYDGQLYGMQIPVISQLKQGREEKLWTLCGSLCTTADVLTKNVPLKALTIGDVLVFHRTGAYSAMEGMAIFLSREMPVIASYSDARGMKIIRERILTDVFNTPAKY